MLTEEQLTAYAAIRAMARTYLDLQDARKRVSLRLSRANMAHVTALLNEAEAPADLLEVEHSTGKHLTELYLNYAPPGVVAWQERSKGIGPLQTARLIGEIGHPRWMVRHSWMPCSGKGCKHPDHKDPEWDQKRHLIAGEPEPRSVRQLYAICGHGDPKRRMRKGMTAEEVFSAGNPTAKVITYLMAVQCVKAGGRAYRRVYDLARVQYAERLHAEPCARCGARGHPAKEGTAWRPAHQHAAALRKLGKQILKDMWVAAGE